MLKLRAFNNVTKRWRSVDYVPHRISGPIEINPTSIEETPNGLPIPFPVGASPLHVTITVVETFNVPLIVFLANQNGNYATNNGSPNYLVNAGEVFILPIDSSYPGDPILELYLTKDSGDPEEGKATLHLVYLDKM